MMYTYNRYLKDKFGEPVLKIPVNAGFSCPNRDGTKSKDGCFYCDNRAFSPVWETKLTVYEQLLNGIKGSPQRFSKYIAYFQPYSNTYGTPQQLRAAFESVLRHPDVVGIAVGTRPDCFGEGVFEYLFELSKKTYLSVELGLQTSHNSTLKNMNRCQTHQDAVESVRKLSELDIETVVHLILGLPGESKTMMFETAEEISKMPVHGIKLHQLMIIRGTKLEQDYKSGYADVLSLEEYAGLIREFLKLLKKNICVHRLMADSTFENGLIAPEWSADKINSLSFIHSRITGFS